VSSPAYSGSNSQVHFGCDWPLEEILPQQAGGKEEDLDALDFACTRIQSGDNLVAEFFRFLLGVGRTLADVANVGVAIVLERQLFCYSISPSFSLRAT
jgi:hypothetical protein